MLLHKDSCQTLTNKDNSGYDEWFLTTPVILAVFAIYGIIPHTADTGCIPGLIGINEYFHEPTRSYERGFAGAGTLTQLNF